MAITALEATAGEVMSSPPIVVSETVTLKEAAHLMIDSRIGCLPVVDQNGKMTGIITERTFQAQIAGVKPATAYSPDRRVLEELYVAGPDTIDDVQEAFKASYSKPVSETMLQSQPTVSKETPVWKVAEVLLRNHLSHVVVILDDKPIGVIARHDLLRVYAGT